MKEWERERKREWVCVYFWSAERKKAPRTFLPYCIVGTKRWYFSDKTPPLLSKYSGKFPISVRRPIIFPLAPGNYRALLAPVERPCRQREGGGRAGVGGGEGEGGRGVDSFYVFSERKSTKIWIWDEANPPAGLYIAKHINSLFKTSFAELSYFAVK